MNVAAALLVAALLPQMQVRESPKDWKLIRTGHFDVYYPDDAIEARAKEFAGWFEEAHKLVREETGTEIKRTVNVFLYRSFHDLEQASFFGQLRQQVMLKPDIRGFRTLIPDRDRSSPHICRLGRHRALAIADPLHDRVLIHCQASDRYNIWFIRHELVHHAQFEAMYPWRVPSWLLALKNPLVPEWWMEGYADYAAGIFDSRKDEYMRDLHEEGLFWLDELFKFDALNLHDYLAPYHEGSYFIDFLERSYGKGTAQRLFRTYTHSFPYPMRRIVARATGKSAPDLQREFAEKLGARYDAMMEGRRHADEFAVRLTDNRQYYRRGAWGARVSPDGTRIAYVSDENVRPDVFIGPLSEPSSAGSRLWLRRGWDVQGIHAPPNWSPDSTRVVTAVSWKNRDYLMVIWADGGSDSITLDFDEIYDPCFAPDGEGILFGALKDGYGDLYVYRDGKVEQLTKDRDGDWGPAWSPDGKTIVYVSESGGRPQLCLLDVATKKRRKLGDSWALVDYPRWTPDGKSVVVSADVDGVFDIFRVGLDGSAERLTKVRIGAHMPDVTPDGRHLLFNYAQNRGSDLFRVEIKAQEEPGFAQEERKTEYEAFTPPDPQGEPAAKRRKFGVEWLMGPVTTASFLTPGAELRIADLDGENSLSMGGMFLGGDYWGTGALLMNTRWRPTLAGGAFAGRLGDVQELGAAGGAAIPLFPNLSLSGGWAVRERHNVEDSPFLEYFDSGPTFGGLFTNMASYQSRDAAWGFAAGGIFFWWDEAFGGDRDLREGIGVVELATDFFAQDWIIWAQGLYAGIDGEELMEDEILELGNFLRGADSRFEGVDLGVASLEIRFPIYRDVMFMPLGFMQLPEYFVLKDIRGFVFAQGGYASGHFEDFTHGLNCAASVGGGLRLDAFVMVWPIFNIRVPLRVEGWWAYVMQDEMSPRGEVGVAVSF